MADCPFYKLEQKFIRSREISAQATGTTVRVPYCTHHHSPAERHRVTRVVGGANLLRCQGDVAACQIPAALRTDC